MTLLSIVLDTATEFGFELSIGPGKTAAILTYRGKHGPQERRRMEQECKEGLPVLTEHRGITVVPVVSHCKHLGGFLTQTGSKLQEIHVRSAQAWSRIGPLRTILRSPALENKHKRTLVKTMGFSVLKLHSGTWWNLTEGEYRAWQAAWFKILGAAYPRDAKGECKHTTLQERAYEMQAPMPQEMLLLQRLSLLAHIMQTEDDFMIGAITENHHVMKERSWWQAVQNALTWMQSQIGPTDLVTKLRTVYKSSDWRGLRNQAKQFKAQIRQAEQAHLLRVRAMHDLVEARQTQEAILQERGWTKQQQDDSTQHAETYTCSQCSFVGKSAAAVAVHEQRKHQERFAVRRFAFDGVCRVCSKQFHTRPRLLTHLHAGSTKCWITLLRTYEPLTLEQSAALDQLDKDKGVALHQKGFKQHMHELACRPSTDVENASILNMKPDPTPMDDEPSIDELIAWSELGMLPPGQGGREVTRRNASAFSVPNVLEDVQQMEKDMIEELQYWKPDDTWIPRPLATNARYVLIFFAGHRRQDDIADFLHRQGDLVPLSIDTAVSQEHGNVYDNAKWITLIRSKLVVAAHAGPPCETFTMARWIKTGLPNEPKPVRTKSHPWGLPELSLKELIQCVNGSSLYLQALSLLILVHMFGGAVTLEHPRGPTQEESLGWTIWMSACMRLFLLDKTTGTTTFLQGPLGRCFSKPTRFLTGHLPGFAQSIYSQYDPKWRPTEWLGGQDASGRWRTAQGKEYPPKLCRIIADNYIQHKLRIDTSGEEQTPVTLQHAIQALSQLWDPYGCSGLMKPDFQKEFFQV